MKNLRRLTSVVFAGFLLVTLATAWSGKTRILDLDGDGYKESQAFYSDGQLVRTLVDADRDGYVESRIHYKNGLRERADQDMNGDGKTDRWVYYYFTGVPWKVAEDFNRDGKPDYWFYLKDGRIYRWEQDRNGDGKADIRTTYEMDTAGKTRTLIQQSYDDDFDGVFESLSGITAVRKEAMIPHSIAEALLMR